MGEFLCSDCFSKISYNQNFQCPACFKSAINGLTHPICQKPYLIDGVIPTVVYRGVVKKLIYQLKYAPYVSALGEAIGEIMNEGLVQNESFYDFFTKNHPVIIPVPLYKDRERKRGYNHAEKIASYVAQYFKLPIETGLLVRIKNTRPQYKLSKKERIDNIRDAFYVPKNLNLPKSAILIDDITTSFSTLKEAAKALKRKGSKRVLGVTFAREI
jgi:ComF family protein